MRRGCTFHDGRRLVDRTRCLASGLMAVAVLTGCTAFVWAQSVSEQDHLHFEQAKALAHMQELEQRMYRLAETIRDAQPDDAARLLLGLREAREAMIAGRMQEVSALLVRLDLGRASDEQQEILAELNRLKDILLAHDMDMRLRLERLRQVRDLRDRLDRLAAAEVQQLDAATALDGLAEPDAARFEALAGEEDGQRQSAEAIERRLRQLGAEGADAAEATRQAGDAMSHATEALRRQQAGDAARQQAEAHQRLADAAEAMGRLEQQMLDELRALTQQQIIDRLNDLLTQQRQVREATQELAPRAAEGPRAVLLAVQRLGGRQDRIIEDMDEVIELIETSEYSVVLPDGLNSVRRRMVEVAGGLKASRADHALVADQRRIEADLESLVRALEAEQDAADAAGGGQQPGGGVCEVCGANQNELLAELKMVHFLQRLVYEQTAWIEEQKRNPDRLSPSQLADHTAAVREDQQAARRALTDLHESFCDACRPGTR